MLIDKGNTIEQRIKLLSGAKKNALFNTLKKNESVIKANESVVNTQRLVAYIVTNEENDSLDINDLKKHLGSMIPQFMVPQSFVYLDKIPLSPNGKVNVNLLPDDSEIKRDSNQFVAAENEIELALVGIWESLLGIKDLGVHDNFFEVGGDSILSIQIVARAKKENIHITPKHLFLSPTIAELSKVAKTDESIKCEQNLITGKLPLTPIQHWLFDRKLNNLDHWNQATFFKVPKSLNLNLLELAIDSVILHHDALRTSFVFKENNWEQTVLDKVPATKIQQFDLSHIYPDDVHTEIERNSNNLHASLNISTAELCAACFFRMSDGEDQLFIVIHHLVVDVVSWSIINEDIQTAYEQLLNNENVVLPPKTTSFQFWSNELKKYAISNELEKELNYWLSLPSSGVFDIPLDKSDGGNVESSQQKYVVSLSEQETKYLLKGIASVYNTKIDDILLTALTKVITQWTECSTLALEMEGHGREYINDDVDLTRTVGWFTSTYPVFLHFDNKSYGDEIKSIKEQLRKIPNKGVGFGILRYLNKENDLCRNLSSKLQAKVIYNYLGQFNSQKESNTILTVHDADKSHHHDFKNQRSHLLEIVSMVIDDQFKFEWFYSENIHSKDTIERLANDFITELLALIEHCKSPDAGGVTASDFPEADLDQDGLLDIIEDINLRLPKSGNNKTDNIEAIYPLSPMQEGMLFHSLFDNSTSYYEQYTCLYDGEFNAELYKNAWQIIVNHNAILRTLVIWEGQNKPLQIVRNHIDLEWLELDWREYSQEEIEVKLELLLADFRSKGFDLKEAPLMNFSLIRTTDNETIFVWNFHHLLLDGWSGALLFNQLYSTYYNLLKKKPVQLKTLTPFSQYINWLQKKSSSDAKQYWQEMLQGFEASNDFQLEKKQDETSLEPAYKKLSEQSTQEVLGILQTLARKHQLTLNTLVQGAWSLLISKYSGDDDVVFGSTVSGRPADLTDVENILGLFINTLPVRIKIDAAVSVFEWLKQIQLKQLESREYEYSHLGKIQKWSEIPNGQSLFDSILVFENFPSIDSDLSTLGFSIEKELMREESNYPFMMGVEVSDNILFNCTYDTSVYKSSTIERMLMQFKNILSNIAQNPEQLVSEISLLNEEEKNTILIDWNNTKTKYSQNCLHHLIEKQAALTPSAIAIAFKDDQLTYASLDKKANKIARYLQKQQIGTGDIVGICMNRSISMIVAMLAIHKSGAGYLPLDPDYPDDRIEYILNDAKTKLLITEEELEDQFNAKQQLLMLDKDWPKIESFGDEAIKAEHDAESIAYVIYTSGSTGQPKGVEVPHRSVVNFLSSMAKKPGIVEDDVLLAVTTVSFDIAVLELFLPLIKGARVELADASTTADGEKLLQLIAEKGVTIMQATPTTWRLMILAGWDNAQSFKVLCGGEALPLNLAEEIIERVGEMWNMYGPTETTVWSCIGLMTKAESPVLIGKPIDNTQIYILDEFKNAVPIGVVGEMYIGGDGISLGYSNQQELTSQKFPSICSEGNTVKVFRTGDLARFHGDGNIEYISRIDNQVKVRGYRIELGEIEYVLDSHEHIQQSIASVRTNEMGDARLIVFYVVNEDVTVIELRRHLQKQLPDYMIPQKFIELEELPTTPNGKVDRLSLPDDLGSNIDDNQFIEPKTNNEKMIASIWSEALSVEKVGVQDNFFEIGGHSLLSVMVLAKIKEKMDLKIELRSLAMDTLGQIAAQYPDFDKENIAPENSDAKNNGMVQTKKERSMISILRGFFSKKS